VLVPWLTALLLVHLMVSVIKTLNR